ncbi:MAG: Na/Pi cotransporter family protein, partial [Bdellovibrionota bacterium]
MIKNPSTAEIAGLILAGLGLFFIGVRFISNNLRLMAGRGFRAIMSRLTQNTYLSSLIGVVAGGITQSTSAITFIM